MTTKSAGCQCGLRYRGRFGVVFGPIADTAVGFGAIGGPAGDPTVLLELPRKFCRRDRVNSWQKSENFQNTRYPPRTLPNNKFMPLNVFSTLFRHITVSQLRLGTFVCSRLSIFIP